MRARSSAKVSPNLCDVLCPLPLYEGHKLPYPGLQQGVNLRVTTLDLNDDSREKGRALWRGRGPRLKETD
jgi:hypothetical protein